MNCPDGYMERNGVCEYVGYMPGDANLDGTPNTSNDQGGNFWSKVGDALNQYGPLILIGAGTFWQSKQPSGNPQPSTGNPPPPAQPTKAGMPVWGWVAIGVGVLLLVVLVARKK